MWRFLTILSVLTTIPLSQGCEPRSSRKTADVPQEKKVEPGPVMPTPEPSQPADAKIQSFSYDSIPLLEAGQDSVPVRLHWETNANACQLFLGDQPIDVSSVSSVTVNVPETMDVQLRCGTAEASINIPVRKKLSIVSLTVESSDEGERIRWDAFGAASCQIQDEANRLDLKNLAVPGEHTVKAATSPLDIKLSCEDGQGTFVTARYDVALKIKAGNALQIDSFSGPSVPVAKPSSATTVAAEIQWKAINAVACQLTFGNNTLNVPASGTQTIQTPAGEVFLECRGSRFQAVRKSLSVQTRPALELNKFSAPDGFYGSRIFSSNTIELQVFGADSCEMKADNAEPKDLRRESSVEALTRGTTVRLPVNVDTKTVALSCQNSYGETLTEVMNVNVLPRVEIYKFTANVHTIKSKWSDETKRPVTLSWDVDNIESCEIKKLSVTDWVPLQRIESLQGQVIVDINRATDFSLECRDRNKMLAYKKIEIKWDREPEQSLSVNGDVLTVKGLGFKSCRIQSPELHYDETLPADPRFVIDRTVGIPMLMQRATFTMTCLGPHGPKSVETYAFTADDEYFVLRQASYTGSEIQFEAAWRMGADAGTCALYRMENGQSEPLASGLPNQGTQSFRFALASNDAVSMKVLCGEGANAASRTFKLEAPQALCESNKKYEPVARIYADDLKISPEQAEVMSCLELVQRLGQVTKVETYDFLRLPDFIPYFNSVRDVVVRGNDYTHHLLYFGKARNLIIDSSAFLGDRFEKSTIQALHALSSLESMELTLDGTQSVDLRYLASSHPKLKTLRIRGYGWYAHSLGLILQEGLSGLKLQTLELKDLAVTETNLASVLDLPLESLTLVNVYCYRSMPALATDGKDCMATVPREKKLSLKHLGADFASIRNLEDFADLSRVESLSYREIAPGEFSWVTRSQPTWDAYESLKRLALENVTSLESLRSADTSRVTSLDLQFKKQDRIGSLAVLKDRFAALTELNLKNVIVPSFFGVWDLPSLETLSLESTRVEEWDLPVSGYTLKTMLLNRDQYGDFPRGFKVARLVLNREALPQLEAGVVDNLEFKTLEYSPGLTKLDELYGKVKSIILNDQRAERLKESVKNCQIRREMQGTVLIYPPFDELWQACETL